MAALLLVGVMSAFSPAPADDESEAEKLEAEESAKEKDAEKRSADLRAEAQRAFEEFRSKLENLGVWCNGAGLNLQRSRVADVLLAFDPENARAREWLGFKRQKNGSWKPGPWRNPVDARPEALAEFAKRRAEVADPLRARFLPLIAECRSWNDAGLRDRLLRSLIGLFPDDASLREMHGEVLVKGKWLLGESEKTPANRERIAAAIAAAKAEAATAPRTIDTGGPGEWPSTIVVEGLEVISEFSAPETASVAEAAIAGRLAFAKVLGLDARIAEETRIYLLEGSDSNDRFLARVKDLTEEERKKYGDNSTYWLRHRDCIVAITDRADRLDTVTRQIIGSLRGPFASLGRVPPWLGEGLGTYLTYRLLGTRMTAFTQSTEYFDDQIAREVAAVDADWIVVVRKLVDKGFALDLRVLTGLPLNSMTKDDGLVAYALAAYFVEARPKDAAALLVAMADRGCGFHRALAETCGLDAEGLQVRFVRWLHEIPAK